LGARIRKERENLNLSREKFAEIVGISPYYLGQIERGDRRMSLEILIKIANTLHVSVDYILFGVDMLFYNSSCNKEYIARESDDEYKSYEHNSLQDLINLLSRCTNSQLSLVKELVKLIIPYLKKLSFHNYLYGNSTLIIISYTCLIFRLSPESSSLPEPHLLIWHS